MRIKITSILRRLGVGFAVFLTLIGSLIGAGLAQNDSVFAEPINTPTPVTVQTNNDSNETSENADNTNNSENTESQTNSENTKNTSSSGSNSNSTEIAAGSCKSSLGTIGWIVCPVIEKVSDAVDWLYGKIEEILLIDPIPAEDGSPIYEIWKYCLGVTNVVFIIFMLIVIYSQLTGWGITNYGLKKALPKLIVMAIMVNLSFLICSLAVDVSNVVGHGLRSVFASVEKAAMVNAGATVDPTTMTVSMAEMYSSMAGGTALAIGGGMIAFELGAIWMLIPTVLGAIVAVATGLITIALRQAVVMLLVMISPLAFVANIMPNTENLFKKWKSLLMRMLVFYPMFSLLFGASSLAGFAIIMSAKDGFGLLLGIAVQIFPLFFSWKLMQMSGTVLGDINARIRGLTARPLAANRAWASTRRQQTSINMLAAGRTPFSRLRRFMDNRSVLREKHTENLQTIRKNQANIYAQRKIGAGYDGTTAQGTSDERKPNRYTRAAKDASTSRLLSEMATADTAHALNNYGDYYTSKALRERIKAAEVAGDKRRADRLRNSDPEMVRSTKAGQAFLEYSRAQMTAENDEEADFNFMVREYLGALEDYDPNRPSDQFSKYRHYIASSAGGLGETGQTRVLGKIIARAAAVETNQRRDINIIAAKYPHDKTQFRSMFVGYHINDDGYAIDRQGNVIEQERGYLLQHDPSRLWLWDQYENGVKYYDWRDANGKFVTRIYETDSSAFKELLSSQDATINDPINNLYGILAGIKPGDVGGGAEEYKHIGLERFRTTIGRALLNAPFKEKNAAFSPMVAEMIKKGYVQNYAQEYLAYLDSLNKATKPGAFNVQDADAIKMMALIMNPEKWDDIFAEDLIRGFRNINGEPLSGYQLDGDGNVVRNANNKPVKVEGREPTYDELMACVKEKFIIPAAHKITMMMSRQTPNTADNQKAGTVEEWKKLKEVFDTKWGANGVFNVDPYEQKGDMRRIAREVRDSLHLENAPESRYENDVEDMYVNSQNDADQFATEFAEYCYNNRPRLDVVLREFLRIRDEAEARGRMMTCDELLEEIQSLLRQFCSD